MLKSYISEMKEAIFASNDEKTKEIIDKYNELITQVVDNEERKKLWSELKEKNDRLEKEVESQLEGIKKTINKSSKQEENRKNFAKYE